MNQRKQNISRWYALGLAAVLVIACLSISVGTAWARYRTEANKSVFMEVRAPLKTYIGKVIYSEDRTSSILTMDQTIGWETVDGQTQMSFAVANGIPGGSFEQRAQEVSIRLIGSLGAWSGSKTASLKLEIPAEDVEVPTVVEAKAERITAGTILYNDFGDGWVFYFLDSDGEELTWPLEGGKLSYVEMIMKMDSGTVTDTSLLQLQVIGELAE